MRTALEAIAVGIVCGLIFVAATRVAHGQTAPECGVKYDPTTTDAPICQRHYVQAAPTPMNGHSSSCGGDPTVGDCTPHIRPVAGCRMEPLIGALGGLWGDWLMILAAVPALMLVRRAR